MILFVDQEGRYVECTGTVWITSEGLYPYEIICEKILRAHKDPSVDDGVDIYFVGKWHAEGLAYPILGETLEDT